jgi:UDP-N-acetylglucosamine--N-acetylmuramyl-(pentapeptide) pyrophosphoryl-undecaprenol N-acetylglucosamine transferase
VNPALAVLETIREKVEVLWIGGEGGMEAQLVKRNGIPFDAIPAAGVHGISPRALPHNLWQLGRGMLASRRILRRFRPEALFFTGGYVAVPMALAGWKIPSLLYVPDIEPGLALNTLAHFADKICVTAEDSFRYFRRASAAGTGKRPSRLVLTGYPTRPSLTSWTRSTARQTLNLNNESPVLLVMGGSKGSRSINNAVLANLPALVEMAQIIHITGELDWPGVEGRMKELTQLEAARYHAFPYLHEEMGAALAAADLALSRAGAATLGEYPLFGLPAVLVPYPYAWRYQKVNADYLVRHGAAVLLEDKKLSAQFLATVKELLSQPEKLAGMRHAMQSLSHPEAAREIGRAILALGRERS